MIQALGVYLGAAPFSCSTLKVFFENIGQILKGLTETTFLAYLSRAEVTKKKV